MIGRVEFLSLVTLDQPTTDEGHWGIRVRLTFPQTNELVLCPGLIYFQKQRGQEAEWGSQGRAGPCCLHLLWTQLATAQTHIMVHLTLKEKATCHCPMEQDEGGWSWCWNPRQAGTQLTRQAEGEWMSAGCVGTEPWPETLAGIDSLCSYAVFTP